MDEKERRKIERRAWLRPRAIRPAITILGLILATKLKWVVWHTVARGKEEWQARVLTETFIRHLKSMAIALLLFAVLWFLFLRRI